jgi:hypothetical protein
MVPIPSSESEVHAAVFVIYAWHLSGLGNAMTGSEMSWWFYRRIEVSMASFGKVPLSQPESLGSVCIVVLS